MSTRPKTTRERQPDRAARAGGFTLVELLVVITVIALLAALLLSGVSRAVGRARALAGQSAVDALVVGVTQFKSEFGFLPPLVHDGRAISDGDDLRRPLVEIEGAQQDGPVYEVDSGGIRFDRLVVWSEGEDNAVFRRRTGTGNDDVEITQGGEWDDATAWGDIRYSKFALPYYLAGVGGVRLDGVDGAGYARPQANGLFVGVGYPVGSTRDRYEPTVDLDGGSLKQVIGYTEPLEYLEHESSDPGTPPSDTAVAFIDPWGRALRYYRWEPGRFELGRLVVETTLDLNLPPVLVDPERYAAIQNDPVAAEEDGIDLTSGNAELRSARFAIVSAGPDGLFGTEPIDEIADRLRADVPGDIEGQAALRKRVWEDNIVGLGN